MVRIITLTIKLIRLTRMSWYVASTVNNTPDDHFIYVNYTNSLEIPYTTSIAVSILRWYILVGGGGGGAPGTDGSGEPNYGGGGGGSGSLISTFQFPGNTGQSPTQGVFTYTNTNNNNNIPICGAETIVNFTNYTNIGKLVITIGSFGGGGTGSGGDQRGGDGGCTDITIYAPDNTTILRNIVCPGGQGGYSAGGSGYNEQGGDGYNGGGGGAGGDNNGPGGNGNTGCDGENGNDATGGQMLVVMVEEMALDRVAMVVVEQVIMEAAVEERELVL